MLGRKIAKLVSAKALTAEILRLEERQDGLQTQMCEQNEPAPLPIHPALAGVILGEGSEAA